MPFKHHSYPLTFLLCITLCWAPVTSASYAIYVGKNLTADGSVMIGGSGDEVSSHWLEVVPGATHASDATVTVGVTAEAFMPGAFSEIPQAGETYRYLTMNYSEYEGFPPPLTNGGLNEHNVAGRDVWSPSRDELVAMTPNPQTGPQYSDLSRIAMERARTAREAVEIIGALIDTYGYSTYGGNSHMFADEQEGWVLLNFAGGKGLWVAERLGPDDVRMSYPGYIGDIPLDLKNSDNFMASANFIDFAIEQGWYNPDSGEAFNVTKVYGVEKERYPRSAMEAELRAAAPIDLRAMMNAVRDPRIAKDSTGYGQVAALKANRSPSLTCCGLRPLARSPRPSFPTELACRPLPPSLVNTATSPRVKPRAFCCKTGKFRRPRSLPGAPSNALCTSPAIGPKNFCPRSPKRSRPLKIG